MIHIMPDKTVRVTSRFPDGRSTVYFDLEHGDGFMLERDRFQPGICTLRMLHGYRNFAARYGDQAEAEADLADLNLMLADRHALPAASSVPALASTQPLPAASSVPAPASTQPPIVLGHARRRGWGWKGAMAGLALGALGVVVATRTLGTNTVADRPMLRASDTARAVPSDDGPSQGAAWPPTLQTGRPILPAPSAAQLPASSAPMPRLPRPQAESQVRPPASSFGLQP